MPRIGLVLATLLGLVSAGLASQGGAKKPVDELGQLTVTVVDEDGEPIFKTGASLSVSEAQKKVADGQGGFFALEQVRTDPDGKGTLSIAPGEERELNVSHRELGSENLTRTIAPMEPGEVRAIDVVLRTKNDAMYTAIVVDGETGRPLAGVVVDVQAPTVGTIVTLAKPALRAPRIAALRTDEGGVAAFPDATWRKRSAVLFAEGFAVRRVRAGGSPKAKGLEAPHEVRLEREALLHVRLVDAPENVMVHATINSSRLYSQVGGMIELSGPRHFRVYADPLGDGSSFLVRGLPSGASVEIFVVESGKLLHQENGVVTPEAGKVKRLAIALGMNGRVRGKALGVDGKPVAGKDVWIDTASGHFVSEFFRYEEAFAKTSTAKDGTFEFERLPPGKYMVAYVQGMERGGGVAAPIAEGVRVDVTGSGDPVDVVLQELMGLTISGKLLDPDGEPARGYVTVRMKGGSWSRDVNLRSDDGTFAVGPLLPGLYMVSGSAHRHPYAASLRIEVEAGAEDVVLQLALGGQLVGTVVDVDGKREAGANLRLQSADGSTTSIRGLRKDGFDFKGVDPQPFALYAHTNDGRISNIYSDPIVPGTTVSGITLTLGPAAQLSLVATDAAAWTAYSVKGDTGFFLNTHVKAGTTEVVTVPLGKIIVTAQPSKTNLIGEVTVDAVAGGPIAVEIELKPMSTEEGAVENDASKEPGEKDNGEEQGAKLALADLIQLRLTDGPAIALGDEYEHCGPLVLDLDR